MDVKILQKVNLGGLFIKNYMYIQINLFIAKEEETV